ncbi:beta strand repeat-containing protein [Rhizobium alvei]|uniref:Calcium-binding protein n=1 Tax=Rhizobium alvei TaxID=1132659 RepID=A0ABT8YI73_9HYPH|nr:calcium-binding protein [Rhizobium alvei]MDO6963326.1 calcium-binding protein [Rhizobium alvei]
MTTTTVTSGTTITTLTGMSGMDELIVEAGGIISVASSSPSVRFAAATDGAIITNDGVIENTKSGGRAIRFETGVGSNLNATIENTGSIQSLDDAIQIQSGAVTSGQITLTNSGTIKSTSGQAIDFAGGTGSFIAEINNTGLIHSESDDGIRIGAVGYITNSATINGGSGSDQVAKADGIQFEDSTSGTVDNLAGMIAGDRHGIDAGTDSVITVNNALDATITGRNGSGVGSDGSATVTNYGTITGMYTAGVDLNGETGETPDGTYDGDGDGVDIDYEATIVNYGTIQGLGANGHGSDGLPNTSEGIAAGGGSITNHENAVISGLGLGILIDDSSQGNAFYLTTIINDGSITGSEGTAIKIISDLDDTITNSGTITGGNGMAIIFGTGDNTLLMSGDHALVDGTVAGGDGTDTLDYSGYSTSVTIDLSAQTATDTDGVTDFEILVGGTAADTLTGSSDDNTITGGAGNDTMAGGLGDDVYSLDNKGDVVTESTDAGTDTVLIAQSGYVLADNVEILTATGTGSFVLTGNALDNTVTGGSSADTLNGGDGDDNLVGDLGDDMLRGGLGADTMMGGAGNDNYYVDDAGDVVSGEVDGGGTDLVLSSISLDLSEFAFVENLTLQGRAGINGFGNDLDNQIIGNRGDNDIGGGLGKDRLTGNGGSDVFHFAAFGADNADRLLDFDANDAIALDRSIFEGLARKNGHLAAADFVAGSAAKVAGAEVVLYNAKTGYLSYDDDGKGGDAAEVIAFIGKKLTDFDFNDILLV